MIPTEDLHRNNNGDKLKFYGKYEKLRGKLDYSYHANYTKERQLLQDDIIRRILLSCAPQRAKGDDCASACACGQQQPKHPWIVFTAGAMGVGKSYTIKRMVERGFFPLSNYATIDPDEIRNLIPEFSLYAKLVPEMAGELTNKESGYIAELLTLISLEKGRNILVDGSLHDYSWYRLYFSELRMHYPKFRIAILHVTAPRDTVLKRANERAVLTGRAVPRRLIEMGFEQIPKAIKILSPLADYVCELRNQSSEEEIEIVTDCEDWDTFKAVWRDEGRPPLFSNAENSTYFDFAFHGRDISFFLDAKHSRLDLISSGAHVEPKYVGNEKGSRNISKQTADVVHCVPHRMYGWQKRMMSNWRRIDGFSMLRLGHLKEARKKRTQSCCLVYSYSQLLPGSTCKSFRRVIGSSPAVEVQV